MRTSFFIALFLCFCNKVDDPPKIAGRYTKNQINASLPFKKRVWQKLVIQKIKNQALSLKFCGKTETDKSLNSIAESVKSGDSDNREAYAAKVYWKNLFGENFIRDKNGDGINAFLNYGYAIMRAGMARAICSHGLIPSLGVHHDNNLNQFCLADDFFEIYRPLVDVMVYKLWQEGERELIPKRLTTLQKLRVVIQLTVRFIRPALETFPSDTDSCPMLLEYISASLMLPGAKTICTGQWSRKGWFCPYRSTNWLRAWHTIRKNIP